MKTSITLVGITGVLLLMCLGMTGAQTSCQATITNPCPSPPPRANNSPTHSDKSNKSSKPQGVPRREGTSVDPDVTFGLSGRGVGLKGKF